MASEVSHRQKLQDEVRYHVFHMVATSKRIGDETGLSDSGSWTFPLSALMQYRSMKKCFNSVDDIR